MSCGNCGVDIELKHALLEVKCVIDQYGMEVEFFIEDENEITRDKYGSIIKDTDSSLKMNAYPLTYNPTDKQIEKAGLRERTEALFYTATQDWKDAGIDFKDIEIIRSKVEINGERYVIKDKGRISQFSDTFLYITFGVSKK